jgi:hypothetical protein
VFGKLCIGSRYSLFSEKVLLCDSQDGYRPCRRKVSFKNVSDYNDIRIYSGTDASPLFRIAEEWSYPPVDQKESRGDSRQVLRACLT